MDSRATQVNDNIEREFLSVVREYERVIYKFRQECKISTWIYRIALNTCISFIRKEKNIPEFVGLTQETDSLTEDKDPLQEMLQQLYRMISHLGQLDKSIILLYLEDKSYEEMAEIRCDDCSIYMGLPSKST